jgi:hypothetical protein
MSNKYLINNIKHIAFSDPIQFSKYYIYKENKFQIEKQIRRKKNRIIGNLQKTIIKLKNQLTLLNSYPKYSIPK